MAPDDLPDPFALMTSMLAVMTRFVKTGCPRQGALVRRQLAYLHTYPDNLLSPPFKATVRRLCEEWDMLLANNNTNPASTTLH